ncbi:PIN domain-containing protein [Edaphobacter sp.]|uniref:PIN domain-containing protein n=1 Tax=Edaphobacter sp. TaxID=1934404 RepID=UPI002DB8846B|nr:PIN domain-containing protein [Edaphobacter sp.]HEU5341553.1 PIN domain-containing protein [Edaphobacter sp.]
MGLILDSSILIAGERRGETVRQVIERVRAAFGDAESALSAVSIIELTHGIYRAKTDSERARRKAFSDELSRDMVVHPVSLAIAQLAGRIEGEQAARGIAIAVEDLIIGATALHLGFDVVTLNVKHFQAIPGLTVVTL